MLMLDVTYNEKGSYYELTVAGKEDQEDKLDIIFKCIMDQTSPKKGSFDIKESKNGIIKFKVLVADTEQLNPKNKV